MFVAATGFLAGSVHVLTGADHLAAVAPLAADGRRAAWRTGVRWGLGHASGVALVALAAFGLKSALALERIDAFASVGERVVGVALIAIGLFGLRRALSTRVHVHEHTHDGAQHAHLHMHAHAHVPADGTHDAPAPHAHGHAALAVGLLHGLCGSSHFLGVLPSLALPSTADAAAYLVGFGAANVIAMAGFATIVGRFAARLASRGARAWRAMLVTCASLSIVIGTAWLAVGALD